MIFGIVGEDCINERVSYKQNTQHVPSYDHVRHRVRLGFADVSLAITFFTMPLFFLITLIYLLEKTENAIL